MRKAFVVMTALLLAVSCRNGGTSSGDAEMDRFIGNLMKKMTLEEKLGQLNLSASGDITTGQMASSNVAAKIKAGQVGGLFNIKGVEKIREVQRIAVEESRLKIPLLFGMDVIHGYETVFPIPLGLSCSWDPELIGRSARIAAQEATADGLCWTFSPWWISAGIPAGAVFRKDRARIPTWGLGSPKPWSGDTRAETCRRTTPCWPVSSTLPSTGLPRREGITTPPT